MNSTTTAALAATSGDERIPRKEASDGLSVSDHCAPMPGEPTTDTEVDVCRTHRLLWQPQSSSRKRLSAIDSWRDNEPIPANGVIKAVAKTVGQGTPPRAWTRRGSPERRATWGSSSADRAVAFEATGRWSKSSPLHPAKSVQEAAGYEGKSGSMFGCGYDQRRLSQSPICTPKER